jgi:hypothetical protein
MKCDICNKEYIYSEDVIHHYTVIMDGILRPHTHVCITCEEKYNLKPYIIKKKEKKKKTCEHNPWDDTLGKV